MNTTLIFTAAMLIFISSCSNLLESAVDDTTQTPKTAIEMVTIPSGKLGTTDVASFKMSATEVTQDQYETIMRTNPSSFAGKPNNPVESVSWFNAVLYCNKLSIAEGKQPVYSDWTADFTKNGYRLPTDTEWEYACRGKTTSTYYWGEADDNATINQYAWYYGSNGLMTHPVGEKKANAFGLYDMSGNVAEWVYDLHPSNRLHRVNRGGSWYYQADRLASGYRDSNYPDDSRNYIGFRICLPSIAGHALP